MYLPPNVSVIELVPAVDAAAATDVDADEMVDADDDDDTADAKGSATRDKIEFKTVMPSCNFFTSDASNTELGEDIADLLVFA